MRWCTSLSRFFTFNEIYSPNPTVESFKQKFSTDRIDIAESFFKVSCEKTYVDMKQNDIKTKTK
jgi:hypothetical protein